MKIPANVTVYIGRRKYKGVAPDGSVDGTFLKMAQAKLEEKLKSGKGDVNKLQVAVSDVKDTIGDSGGSSPKKKKE